MPNDNLPVYSIEQRFRDAYLLEKRWKAGLCFGGTIKAHSEGVRSISANDHLIVSGGEDGSIKVFHSATGYLLRTLPPMSQFHTFDNRRQNPRMTATRARELMARMEDRERQERQRRELQRAFGADAPRVPLNARPEVEEQEEPDDGPGAFVFYSNSTRQHSLTDRAAAAVNSLQFDQRMLVCGSDDGQLGIYSADALSFRQNLCSTKESEVRMRESPYPRGPSVVPPETDKSDKTPTPPVPDGSATVTEGLINQRRRKKEKEKRKRQKQLGLEMEAELETVKWTEESHKRKMDAQKKGGSRRKEPRPSPSTDNAKGRRQHRGEEEAEEEGTQRFHVKGGRLRTEIDLANSAKDLIDDSSDSDNQNSLFWKKELRDTTEVSMIKHKLLLMPLLAIQTPHTSICSVSFSGDRALTAGSGAHNDIVIWRLSEQDSQQSRVKEMMEDEGHRLIDEANERETNDRNRMITGLQAIRRAEEEAEDTIVKRQRLEREHIIETEMKNECDISQEQAKEIIENWKDWLVEEKEKAAQEELERQKAVQHVESDTGPLTPVPQPTPATDSESVEEQKSELMAALMEQIRNEQASQKKKQNLPKKRGKGRRRKGRRGQSHSSSDDLSEELDLEVWSRMEDRVWETRMALGNLEDEAAESENEEESGSKNETNLLTVPLVIFPSVRSIAEHGRLHGHQKAVFCVDYDGQNAVSCSLDETIRLWDAGTGHQTSKIDVESPSWVVKMDEEKIVSGQKDGIFSAYDRRTNERVLKVGAHRNAIGCLDYDDGYRLVCGSDDGDVSVWDMRYMSDPLTFSAVTPTPSLGQSTPTRSSPYIQTTASPKRPDILKPLPVHFSGKRNQKQRNEIPFRKRRVDRERYGLVSDMSRDFENKSPEVIRKGYGMDLEPNDLLPLEGLPKPDDNDDEFDEPEPKEEGKFFMKLIKHTRSVEGVCIDRTRVISGSMDDTIRVWDFTKYRK
ncbi:hypothetical protein BLNAU_6371 [Blattamonas nauphoetae]|uniref:Uncharacterized protein n=1 Tax=Blattamonas nauphoetae TaxID=2049346 RepID=A0ABQ9Y4C4_9EUKA|nr:hypothetical protein BLNAU_6371 [Blattamonas nauphoetae]